MLELTNLPDITEIRNYVFASTYFTKTVGVDSNCSDIDFIRAVMNLEQETHIKYKLEPIITEWAINQAKS